MKKHTNNNIVYDDKMSKKEQKNQHQYIFSHINRTNSITFKEKYDFFYFHAKKILDKDVKDDEEAFIDILKNNAQLSRITKNKLQQNKSSSNFNINNDNDSIIGKLKRVYIKQQHEANKSFCNKKPKHKSILADMLQVNNNENTKSSLISSQRKKLSNSMLIERKKFFDLERMNGYQLFNFFRNEKQFEIYDRQLNIAKTLKNPLLRAKKLLPSNSLNNTFNSKNNLFNSTLNNKNRNSNFSIIPNQTHNDFKNSFLNINNDFDKSFNNNNNLVKSNTHRESIVSNSNETNSHINNTNLFNSKNLIIRMNSINNTFLNSERQMDNSIIKENSQHESIDLNRQRNLKNSSNNNYTNFNDLMKIKDGSETIDSRSSVKKETLLNSIKEDNNFNDPIYINDKEKNITFNISDNALLDKKPVLPLKKVKKNKINYFRKSTNNNDFNKESFLDKINGNNNDANSDMNKLNNDKNTLYSTNNFNRSTLSNTLRSRKQLNQSEINTTSVKPSFKEIKLFNNLARNDSMTELDKNKVLWKNSLSNFMKHKDISNNLEIPVLNKSIAKNHSLISVNKKEDVESSNKILKFKSILEKVSNKQDIQSKSLNKITKKVQVNNNKSKNKNKKVRFFRRESNNSNSFRNKSESSFDSSAQLTNYNNNNSKKKKDEVKNNKIKEFKLKLITREFFKEKVYYNQTKESILKEKQVKIKNQTKKHRQSINLANEVKKLGRTSFFIKRNNALKNVISQNEFSKELSKLIKEKEEEYKKLFITKTSEEEKEEEINKFINDFQEKKRQEDVLKIKNNPHQTLIKITKNLEIDKNEDISNDNISLSESIKKRLNNISNKYNESLEVNKSNPEDEESKGNEKRSSVFAKDKKIQDKLANKQLAELIPGFDLNTLKPIKKQIIENKEITIDYFTNIPMKLRDLIRIDFLIIKKEYKPRGITPKKYKIKNTILGNNFTKLIINHAIKLQSKVKKCNSDDFNFRERIKQINDQKTKKKKNYINIFFLSKNIPLTRSQLMLNELVNEDSSSEEKDLLHLRKKDDYNNEKGNYQVSDSSNNEQIKKRNATKKSTVNLKKYLINSTKNLYPTKNLSKNVFNANSINELGKKNNELISVKNLDDKVKQNREFLITEEEELEKEISMKNSDSESEDSSSVERFTILKNQENLNYLEPYLFDNFSKDYNKLIYKGKLLDVTKVLERNKISLLNRLDPGIFKTYDMITAFRKYGKAKKSDIDIIIEYMEQKVEEIDRFLYKFNIHYLKHEYEKATFPIFEKEFNKLFMNYPYVIRDFMKQRYFSKFGDPFKNPRIMMNISEAITKANGTFKKEVTNKSLNKKTIVDEILEKYPPYYQLKRQKERFKIKGTMKILDVPNSFNKINLYEKNEILEKEMKQKFNFNKEDYLKDISIPKYKYLKEPKLKGYKSFKRSLDFLQEESSKNHNNLIKTQKYFAKRSLYVDPSLCVIEQRDFNEPEKKVPIKNMWIQ